MEFCSIASGSSGNSIFVGTDHASILIDAGISCKRITEALKKLDRKPQDLTGILITHEHRDHIAGLGVLSRKARVPMYATAATIRQILRYAPLGEIDRDLFHEIRADEPFMVGDVAVQAFHISHDAADPVAYRMESSGKSVAVATDMGCYGTYEVEHLRGLDALLIESNHDVNMLQVGPYPYPLKRRILGEKGHLSNDAAGRLLTEVLHDNMKQVYLGHLSETNNYGALAYATVVSEINESGECPYHEGDIPIEVASRDHPMDVLEL